MTSTMPGGSTTLVIPTDAVFAAVRDGATSHHEIARRTKLDHDAVNDSLRVLHSYGLVRWDRKHGTHGGWVVSDDK